MALLSRWKTKIPSMIAICLPLPGDGQYQTQWDYILSSFPPDRLWVLGDESDAPETNVFNKLAANYIEDCSQLPEDVPLVVLAPENGRYVRGDVSLDGFEHPEDVIYFFGHDTRWVDDSELGGRTPDFTVFIPTATQDDLWSWQAAAITLWDRRMKNG